MGAETTPSWPNADRPEPRNDATGAEPNNGACPQQPGETAAAQPPPEGDPPPRPRLGIGHLLAATGLVAGYLGVARIAWDALESSGVHVRDIDISSAFSGVLGGLALGGPVLVVAFRLRRVRFPYYPGEYLFVIMGVRVLVGVVIPFLILWAAGLAVPGPAGGMRLPLFIVFALADPLLAAILCLWGALRVHEPGWRGFFAVAFVETASICCCLVSPRVDLALFIFLLWMGSLSTLVLMVVVISDIRRHKAYPWTHWTPVFLRVANLVFLVGVWMVSFWGTR